MKRLIFVVLFLLMLTVNSNAQNAQRVNTTINSSTRVAIVVPRSNAACTDYSWGTNDGTGYTISDDAAGTNETTIPDDVDFDWGCMSNPTGTLFWIKATSTATVFTVFYQDRR